MIMPKISIYYVYHTKTNYNYWKPNIIINCPETLKVCYGILSKLKYEEKKMSWWIKAEVCLLWNHSIYIR